MEIKQKLRFICTVALLPTLFGWNSYALEERPKDSPQRDYEIPALIYNGDMTANGDPEAITEILDNHEVTYQLASSEEFNAMTAEDFSKFGIIIWPGGYAGYMSESLLPATRELISKAVTEQGVGFVGFCAGAFMAVSPAALPGEEGPAWGLGIVPDDILPYYHLEDEGTEYAMVDLKLADQSIRSVLWWGGPILPEFPHGVIARYTDTGEPAIAETWAGKGLVVLAAPHPESPENWRTKLGLIDADGLDQDIAWEMFEAALTHKPMPTLD
ncbi:MAG: hypothetical protein ABIQ95_03665 [Bdellovibrionia bacterium]